MLLAAWELLDQVSAFENFHEEIGRIGCGISGPCMICYLAANPSTDGSTEAVSLVRMVPCSRPICSELQHGSSMRNQL